MNSIFLTLVQHWGYTAVAPWHRASIGVLLSGGGLKFLPWAGFLPRDWLPLWVRPVALAVTSYGIGESRTEGTTVPSGFVVGVVIDGRAWVVLYDGLPRDAKPRKR